MESLTRMREEVLNREKHHSVEDFLDRSQPLFDHTLEIGGHPSCDSIDTDEDNRLLIWMVQKIMVLTSAKGMEKVVETTSRR